MTKRKVYLNPKQLAFIQSQAKNKDIIGGRGSGKTGLIGVHNFQKFQHMPGALSGLAALTFGQLLNNTLPSMEQLWRRHGLVEHISEKEPGNYIIGKRPPDYWLRCINRPKKFDNVISFINGYSILLISVDRIDTVRGLSLDALDVDEKGWVKQDDYTKVLSPLVRAGEYAPFAGHPLHRSKCGFSSMPWLAKQHWILEAEEHAKQDPAKHFYIESTAEDNIHVLGKEYLEDAQRTLPDIVYQVEYMNFRPKRVSSAFYPAFNDEVHMDAFTYSYDRNEAGLWIANDSDVHRDKPLLTSWDFNAAFTSMLVCQEYGSGQNRQFRVCNELFVETAKVNLVQDLCDKFIAEYKNHSKKIVHLHGDRNGNNRDPKTNQTAYEQITKILTNAGWQVYNMVSGLDGNHKDRYLLISRIMAEQETYLFPLLRINQNKCKYLPITLQLAPMIGDYQKDKNSERPGNDQKKATHLTDCLDNILWRLYGNIMASQTERYEVGIY